MGLCRDLKQHCSNSSPFPGVGVSVFPTTGICLQEELSNHKCKRSRLEIWQRGVDTDAFNPRFRSMDMRSQLTDGNPSAPLLIHVGRLGAEKNLFVLKDMLQKIPGAHLAFVGDGPSRKQLQEHFKDMPNVKFMVRVQSIPAHSSPVHYPTRHVATSCRALTRHRSLHSCCSTGTHAGSASLYCSCSVRPRNQSWYVRNFSIYTLSLIHI